MLMPLGVLSQYIFGSLLFVLSFLIIAIILLQRGRGGGLTGALGGLGGQSAFGVKAGDIFTRITAVLVLLWIFFSALAARWYKEDALDIQADTSATTSMSTGGGMGGTSELPAIPSVVSPATAPATPAPATPTPTPAPAPVTEPAAVPTEPAVPSSVPETPNPPSP